MSSSIQSTFPTQTHSQQNPIHLEKSIWAIASWNWRCINISMFAEPNWMHNSTVKNLPQRPHLIENVYHILLRKKGLFSTIWVYSQERKHAPWHTHHMLVFCWHLCLEGHNFRQSKGRGSVLPIKSALKWYWRLQASRELVMSKQ